MRTLSALLLAAQRARSQYPRVRILVRDKQPRWSELGSQDTVDAQSALCSVTDALLLAALDTSGGVWVRRVTDPTQLDPLPGGEGVGWGHWPEDFAQVATDALAWPNGDVAISGSGSAARLFYVKSDGAQVLCRASADGGATWGAAQTVKAVTGGGASYAYRLASATPDDAFWCFSRPGYRYVYYRKHAGGAWGSEKALTALTETGGEFNACGGLSAVWWAAQGVYALAAAFWGDGALDGRIVTARFDPTAEPGAEVTDVARSVPPGLASPGFTPLWPCLWQGSEALDGRWVLTYTDRFSAGGASWTAPVALLSRDFEHWSGKLPLPLVTTGEPRWALAELDSAVYCHRLHDVCRLDLWYADKPGYELTQAQSGILRYRIQERPGQGELTLELDNRDGRFDHAGVAGDEGAPALRPLAQVIVEQGLKTGAGDDRVERRPFLLWSVTRCRGEGRNWARLYAVDGWELFRRWRPDATYIFSGRTLAWCIAELAARVGDFRVTFDAAAAWSDTVEYLAMAGERTDWSGRHQVRAWGRWVPLRDPSVVLDPGLDGYTILQGLLGLVGGVARWGNDDDPEALHCLIPAAQGESPPPDHVYHDGEVLEGEYADSFAWPTRVRATGDGVVYEAQDVANSLEVGLEFYSLLYHKQWTTPAQCQAAAQAALDDAEARRWGGWVRTRPHAGLELWDVIALSDSAAGAGLTLVKRRVNGLLTEFEPLKGIWQQTVSLEGV